jgi:beta-xylosidase
MHLALALLTLCSGPPDATGVLRQVIPIRDPFVVPHEGHGVYYMAGTHWPQGPDPIIPVYWSRDLERWHGPETAFTAPPDFWADRDFWAPEIHAYQGKWYLFASFKSADQRRGTQILVADHPAGPYAPHSDGPVTPRDWECLDGTLFVDGDGQPWMVFCHEWVQVFDGEVCAIRLSEDLSESVGEPVVLWKASEAGWPEVAGREPHQGIVTDGPWLHRLPDGTLLMLWSSFIGPKEPQGDIYAVGQARSKSGSLLGPWEHHPEPLYGDDGGHPMLFRTFDGALMLSLHAPNGGNRERARFLPVTIGDDGWLRLADD